MHESIRPVVIAPTYNNARMLREVLDDIAAQGLPVTVVNDGSTDDTPRILLDWLSQPGDRQVLTHPINRGKAAALRTGFTHAAERGFTHAVTIDTDGQLDPRQIGDLVNAAAKHSAALIVGDRDAAAPDYPKSSRAGRRISNWWIRLESGAMISDSQCGFRVYPLELLRQIRTYAGRYGFETEVLTRAAWAGAQIVPVPVSCRYSIPGGRISHLKPTRDTIRHVGLHARLMLRTLSPMPVKRVDRDHPRDTGTIARRLWNWFSPARAWRLVRHTPGGARQFAASLATGIFIANLPLYGVQTVLAIAIARRFGWHPLPAVIGSHLSTPPIGPILIAAAVGVGHWVLNGDWPNLADFDPRAIGYVGLVKAVIVQWTLGSVIVGGTLAALVYLITSLLLRRARSTAEVSHATP